MCMKGIDVSYYYYYYYYYEGYREFKTEEL